MRRRQRSRSLLAVMATVVVLLILPGHIGFKLRSAAVVFVSPLWRPVVWLRSGSGKALRDFEKVERKNCEQQEVIAALEERLQQKAEALWEEGIQARVIYRSGSGWENSFWVAAGKDQIPTLEKNSRVVWGNSVVGVVDEVGARRSRVRLITDAGLTLSVRVARGDLKNASLRGHAETLLAGLDTQDKPLRDALEHFLSAADRDVGNWFLAKGEVSGTSTIRWRKKQARLRGTGFNCDRVDCQGPARDLRTGKSAGNADDVTPIIMVGDLLVTTGMDGVFPPGLSVGYVTKIAMLREGGYYHDVEATPAASRLDMLRWVTILPPLPQY